MPLILFVLLFGAEPSDALARARVCWAALDTDCAELALSEARAELDAYPLPEQLEILGLSAELELSADRAEAARPYIRAALERDPAFAPAWSEAWLAVVDEVRKTLPDRLPPTVDILPIDPVPPKKPVVVTVLARDPSGIASVTVNGLVALTSDGERWQVTVPATMVKIPDLRLDAVAADRAGNSRAASRVVAVMLPPKPPSEPVTSKWWFWTAIGAGAAVLTATAVVLASDDDATSAGPGHGSINIITVGPGGTP